MATIALDYDGTYTADPVLWDAFIAVAQGRWASGALRHGPPQPSASISHPAYHASAGLAAHLSVGRIYRQENTT